jgi:hypothetical protein
MFPTEHPLQIEVLLLVRAVPLESPTENVESWDSRSSSSTNLFIQNGLIDER